MKKPDIADISKDMKKLRTLIKKIPKDRQPVAQSLFSELLFMQKTLETLKQQVDEEGPTAMFKQGKQEFLREHPAMKSYNTTVQRYSLLYKQITDLLPESDEAQQKDPLLDFIRSS